MSKKDYYSLLGVSKAATSAELKKAYHKLAMKLHPDRNPNDKEAERKFKEVNEAYDVLKDEQKKAAYDRFGHEAFKSGAGSGGFSRSQGGGFQSDINEVFSDFFGDFMGSRSGGRSQQYTNIRGSDLRYNINVTLEEVYKGAEKNISFTKGVKCNPCQGTGSEKNTGAIDCDACGGAGVKRTQQGFFTIEQACQKCMGAGKRVKDPCSRCRGQGRYQDNKNLLVTIPAGIENGTRMRLTGEGEAGIRGGNSGDLYIDVSIQPHSIFKVESGNLYYRFPVGISFATAVLGGNIEVPSIEGEKINLEIPAGTQSGEQLRIKNRGMPMVRSNVKGDLFVHIVVTIPKKLTQRQKELLIEFDKESGNEASTKEEDGSFLNKMKNLWS